MSDQWHQSFNPQRFLANVNLDLLIERSGTFRQPGRFDASCDCILCAQPATRGLVLNDGARICSPCFEDVCKISYPETYEARRRKYIAEVESRRLARAAFQQRYGQPEPTIFLGLAAVLSLGLLHFGSSLVVVPIVLAVGHAALWTTQKVRFTQWATRSAAWDREYPPPVEPELLHFHDSRAALTARDRAVLKIFNNWPGYPPFWLYLRDLVLARDNHRCQVTGCPSRVSLHVHHKMPIADGGQHIPDNLVTLCDFHHALEPQSGHERIWNTIRTRYFTLVRTHERSNRTAAGKHLVRAHLRRLQLVTMDEIKAIADFYVFACANCARTELTYEVLEGNNVVRVRCKGCNGEWEGSRALAEETGPRIAETCPASRNAGTWRSRWEMLASRTDSTFRSAGTDRTPLAAERRKQRRVGQATKGPRCPRCGGPMRLVVPSPGKTWKAFWGCSNFRRTGCRGSLRVE